MTIEGLSGFLSKKVPFVRNRVGIELFAHQRVAIDGQLFSYAYMSTAINREAKKLLDSHKLDVDPKAVTRNWLARWVDTIASLREAHLDPVIVFDGADIPPEKAATRALRKEVKDKVKKEIEALREQLASEDLELNRGARERLVKLLPKNLFVTESQHISLLEDCLRLADVIVLTATGEGEALCAELVESGACYAGYTEDSDMAAYHCRRVILGIDKPTYTADGTRVQLCDVIYYPQVERVLKLTSAQMLDLCVMCGTDYNHNVKGIGPAKAYALLLKYGSLDHIPVSVYDAPSLNYHRVREIFHIPARIAEGQLKRSKPDVAGLTAFLAGRSLLASSGRLLAPLGGNKARQEVRPIDYDDAEML